MNEKWLIHIVGTDDVIKEEDELTALREANEINKLELTLVLSDDAPLIMAVVTSEDENQKFDRNRLL